MDTQKISFEDKSFAVSKWACEFTGSNLPGSQASVVETTTATKEDPPSIRNPSFLLDGDWGGSSDKGFFAGAGGQAFIVTIDFGKHFVVSMVHVQGRRLYYHPYTKHIEALIGMDSQPIFTTTTDGHPDLKRDESLVLCGTSDMNQREFGQLFHIPCRGLIIGRYLGLRMKSNEMGMIFATVGVTTADFILT